MSVEEYLAMDRDAEVKSEYHDGEVFELEGLPTLGAPFFIWSQMKKPVRAKKPIVV